ncbi:hypothetical protein B0181_04960 [Moraxella caviae]|uniref:Uncharacterized protein n=1 Tax=Moraxella caviae TaxID=34060 RepID=A0A1T0A3F6_9GAMM|nr:hypothetical protein [Moraxella caviae]OOR90225.1 hypothetical protein B0181_04960 [Moraxella caviae]STZ14555.1 Uncharacterised protein [Moraxella caviae]VEW12560.1 Uncharacterised protein [Moraxella caviae]
MQVLIIETNEIATLNELIDPKNGCDLLQDFIGNHGGFGENTDSQFKPVHGYIGDDYVEYITSQDNYNWWNAVVANQQEAIDLIAQMADEHGEKVHEIAADAGQTDLEDQASAIIHALNQAFN